MLSLIYKSDLEIKSILVRLMSAHKKFLFLTIWSNIRPVLAPIKF